MAESTITSKGQTTVPSDIRAHVQAKPGTRLVWSAMPVHIALATQAGEQPLWTFDKGAAKVIGAQLIRTR